jgi:hypothetical protein
VGLCEIKQEWKKARKGGEYKPKTGNLWELNEGVEDHEDESDWEMTDDIQISRRGKEDYNWKELKVVKLACY